MLFGVKEKKKNYSKFKWINLNNQIQKYNPPPPSEFLSKCILRKKNLKLVNLTWARFISSGIHETIS